MKKTFLLCFVFLIFAGLSFSQSTTTTTVYYTGFQACGGCTVCGMDYWCFNTMGSYCGNTGPCGTKSFFDPVPAGNLVTNIQVQYYSAECSGGSLTATINGYSVPTVYEGATGCWCSNNPCAVSATSSSNYPCGMPGYVYGGWNSLQLCTGADVCVNKIVLVITYYLPSAINPTITAYGPVNFCQGGNVTLDAGPGYAAYSWNTGANTQTINVSTSGTYVVTVTSITGCTTGSASINVNVYPNPTPSISASGPISFCQGGSVVLDAGAGYSGYTWSTGAGTQSITVSTSGTYGVTVTSANGCTGYTSINVTANPVPSVSASSTQAGCTVANGSATASPSGGTPNYTYLWSNGDPNQTANNLAAGNYNVTVTDANGCTAVTSVNVPTASGPSVSASGTQTGCTVANGSATASPSGGAAPYTYLWSNGDINQTANNLTAGTYNVTVTDANGCTAVTSVTISTANGPTVSASGTQTGCTVANGSATATPSGGTLPYTYLWSNGDPNQTANNLAAGTYNVTVTDANGCTAVTSVTISTANGPTVSASGTQAGCAVANGSATATPSGGTLPYTYLWSNGDPNQTANNLAAGTYTITLTDANGCSSVATVNISNTASPSVSATSTSGGCTAANGTATANPSGGTPTYTYLWSDGQATQTATGLATGTYTVILTDANGCTAMTTVNITSTAGPSVTATSVSGGCLAANGSATATPSGGTPGYTYLWSNSQVTQTATGLATGTYTVIVTDANGCTATTTVSVTSIAGPTATAAPVVNVSCNGLSDGSGIASPIGGTAPYSYSWNTSPAQNTQTATGLPAGSYTIVVTDANGCTALTSVTITQPALLISVTTSNAVTCYSGNNGTATSTPTGGTPNYTYLWNNGQTNATATGLTAGNYSVAITDANGCTWLSSVAVTEPPVITLSVSGEDTICVGENTTLTASTLGGTPAYTYVWVPGPQNGNIITVNPTTSTSYSVSLTDANGCTSLTQVFSIIVTPAPLANFDTISNGMYGSVFSFNDLSSGGLSWFWNFGDGDSSSLQNPVHTFPGAGTYTVTQVVFNQLGCPDTFRIIVTIGEGITIPNVFTPDNDGVNDVWFIPNSGMKEFHVEIFDRWGAKVFETTADEIRWDGHSTAGKLLNDGTYFFVLKAVLKSSGAEKDYSTTGNVTLLTKKR